MTSSKILAFVVCGLGGYMIGTELTGDNMFVALFGILLMTVSSSVYGRLSANDPSEHH